MKLLIVLIVVLFNLSNVRTDEVEKPLPCSYTFRCSQVEDPVWATDGVNCYVFINQCLLGLENCIRYQNGQLILQVVDQDKCRCNSKCPECDKPICGYRNGTLLEFPSLCWMEYYNCQSGQIYFYSNDGPCKR